jgi:hypothetical protein
MVAGPWVREGERWRDAGWVAAAVGTLATGQQRAAREAGRSAVVTSNSNDLRRIMATQADVRRIALALPGVVESTDRFAFSVVNKGKAKGIAWVWLERTAPKAARVPNPKVLAVRVATLREKEMILASDPGVFFTEPHYNGYPAVLVRLAAIRVPALRVLLEGAWSCSVPRSMARGATRETPRAAPGGTARRRSARR